MVKNSSNMQTNTTRWVITDEAKGLSEKQELNLLLLCCISINFSGSFAFPIIANLSTSPAHVPLAP